MKQFKPDTPWKLYIVVAVPLVLTIVLAIVLLTGKKDASDSPAGKTTDSAESLFYNPNETIPPVTIDISSDSGVPASSSDTSVPTDSDSPPPETTTPPAYDAPPLTYVSTETLSGSESDNGREILRYEIKYPVFAAAEGSSAAPDQLNAGLAEIADDYEQYALEELLTYAKQASAAGDAALPYTFSVDFTIEVCSVNAVSVVFLKTEHAGETHDSHVQLAYNYSPVNDAAYALSDVFSVPSSSYLSSIYEDILAEIATEPAAYYGDYENLVRFFDISTRWYFSEDGMVIFFNPFEIAPYDAGIVEFILPYGNLSDIMKINPLYMG